MTNHGKIPALILSAILVIFALGACNTSDDDPPDDGSRSRTIPADTTPTARFVILKRALDSTNVSWENVYGLSQQGGALIEEEVTLVLSQDSDPISREKALQYIQAYQDASLIPKDVLSFEFEYKDITMQGPTSTDCYLAPDGTAAIRFHLALKACDQDKNFWFPTLIAAFYDEDRQELGKSNNSCTYVQATEICPLDTNHNHFDTLKIDTYHDTVSYPCSGISFQPTVSKDIAEQQIKKYIWENRRSSSNSSVIAHHPVISFRISSKCLAMESDWDSNVSYVRLYLGLKGPDRDSLTLIKAPTNAAGNYITGEKLYQHPIVEPPNESAFRLCN